MLLLVSVISVFYNRAEYVLESVNSILDQTYKNLEIILVDDGSTDNTYDLFKEFDDNRIKLIKQQNQGFTKSIIDAIKLSKGEVVAIHGSGDISLPNRIEEQVKIIERKENIGIVGCYVENIDKESGVSNLYIPRTPNGNQTFTDLLIDGNIFTHGEVMFKKEIYNKVGGYRSFFKYTQDYDLWMRMSLKTDYFIIPKKLYRRYRLNDGVSSSVFKKAIQKYYGSIVRQCVEMLKLGKPDLIDIYGDEAAFFRRKDKDLSKKFAKMALHELIKKNNENSKLLIDLSRNEVNTIFNYISKKIINLSIRFDIINKILIVLLEKSIKL